MSANLVKQASPAGAGDDVSRLGFVGPVNDECPALYIIARQEPPIAAVLGVIAVIAHYKVMFRRNSDWTVVLARIAAECGPIAGFDFLRHRGRLFHVVGMRLVDQLAIDVNALVPYLDLLARQSNDPLDEIPLRILRVLEHDHFAAGDFLHGKERPFDSARIRAEYELIDEQVIANQEVGLHRSGRNLEGLDDKGPDEERQHARDDERLEILARDRFLEPLRRHSPSVPILSTARNASCGISTLPTRFMRFFPSFCFSSSLRLREMSPP